MTYPRRTQLLYRARSCAAYVSGGVALAAAPLAARSSLAAGAIVVAAGLGLLATGHLDGRRAARYRVGADSEALVAHELRALEARGWKVRNSMEWPGRGDIDHVVWAPGGAGFAIETKTGRYEREHVMRTHAAAKHVGRACVPVICLAGRRGILRVDHGVLVVSADRLVAGLVERGAAR